MKKSTAISLILLAISLAVLSFAWIDVFWQKCIVLGMTALMLLFGIYLLFAPFRKGKHANIQRLILINGDGERDKEWVIAEGMSFLIGRSAPNHHVDIDLSENRYEDFVALSHAVLNRMGEDWYIEDMNTVNGVGIKKSGSDYNYRIQPNKPYKIDIGDMIYIAKLRLLAK